MARCILFRCINDMWYVYVIIDVYELIWKDNIPEKRLMCLFTPLLVLECWKIQLDHFKSPGGFIFVLAEQHHDFTEVHNHGSSEMIMFIRSSCFDNWYRCVIHDSWPGCCPFAIKCAAWKINPINPVEEVVFRLFHCYQTKGRQIILQTNVMTHYFAGELNIHIYLNYLQINSTLYRSSKHRLFIPLYMSTATKWREGMSVHNYHQVNVQGDD